MTDRACAALRAIPQVGRPGDTPSPQHAENRYFLRFIGTNLEKMHDNTAVLAFTESVPAD